MELTAGDISEYECKLAIQQMQNNKAPGYRFTKALTQIVKLRNYFLL